METYEVIDDWCADGVDEVDQELENENDEEKGWHGQ